MENVKEFVQTLDSPTKFADAVNQHLQTKANTAIGTIRDGMAGKKEDKTDD